MVVGLRDEAQNRKCPVSRTLVTPHVPAHDRAFRGLLLGVDRAHLDSFIHLRFAVLSSLGDAKN